MPIILGPKGSSINGVPYPPGAYIDFLTPDLEAQEVQGGDAFYTPARNLTPTETAAVRALVSGAGINPAVVTLPSGYANVAATLPNALDGIRQSSFRHTVWVIDSDSTSNGYASTSAPIYPHGCDLLNGATILGNVLRGAGIKVNKTNWFGQRSFQIANPSNSIGRTDPRVTVGSGVAESMGSSTTFGGAWFISGTGKLSFQCDEPVDSCRVIYFTNGAGNTPGTLTVDIGASTLYSVSCAVAADTFVSPVISLGAPGLHTINLGTLTNGQLVAPYGVMAWNSNHPGLTILNNGGTGKSMNQAATVGQFSSKAVYAKLVPDLVMVHLILNSMASGTYATDLASLVATIKANATDLMMYDGAQPSPAASGYANYAAIKALNIAAAQANGAAHVSYSDYLGANPGGAGNNLYLGDAAHMKALGYSRWYTAFGQLLASSIAGAA